MASRFRAGDEDEKFPPFFERSPPPHPASTDGYFSLQAMRAGFMGGDGPMRRPRMSLEALEMELREERIREEIIARRIAQRRMVEEQAWREMEMAVAMRMGRLSDQPLPVDPLMLPPPPPSGEVKFGGRREFEFGRDSDERRRFGPRFGRRDLPKVVVGGSSASLQEVEAPGDVEFGKRDVEFEERERLPVRDVSEFGAGKKLASGPEKTVTKMDEKVIPPKLLAIKRKAPAAILGTSSSKFPRPAQKEWSCALCQVSATCEDGLNEHLQGKKHLSKAAQLAPKKNLAVTVLAKNDGSGSSSSVSKQRGPTKKKPVAKGVRKVSIQVDGKLHEVSEKGRFLWCWMCKVKCNGQSAMISHLSGKRHLLEESKNVDAMAKGTLQNKVVVEAMEEEGVTLQNEEVVEAMEKEVTLQNEEVAEATEKEVTLQNEEVVEEKKECTEETEQNSETKDISGSEE